MSCAAKVNTEMVIYSKVILKALRELVSGPASTSVVMLLWPSTNKLNIQENCPEHCCESHRQSSMQGSRRALAHDDVRDEFRISLLDEGAPDADVAI